MASAAVGRWETATRAQARPPPDEYAAALDPGLPRCGPGQGVPKPGGAGIGERLNAPKNRWRGTHGVGPVTESVYAGFWGRSNGVI